ncbi:protein YgfX [Vibrio algarum]|uniref:protein YgfX n=1 Tax=Vibrio algarum TaxID=3020714 RepID=UPI00389AA767
MSRITEANYANNSLVHLYLSPSKIAHIVQSGILILIIWAVLISPMPIVVSLSLIASIIRQLLIERQPSISGRLELYSSGKLTLNNQRLRCGSIFTLYKPLMIQIATVQGVKINIWRDACVEKEYRQLLVMLNFLAAQKRSDYITP